MNTRFLETLLAVGKHGSMAEAARRLNLTHGAVAQQVRALEQELGVALVSRAGRTVHLTEAGYRVIDQARQIVDQIGGLRSLAKADAMQGEFRLGAGNSALNTVVPEILARIIEQNPLLNVYIRPGLSSFFYPAVEQDELDAAIALETPFPLPKSLGWQLLREEPFVLIAAARHHGKAPHDLLRSQPFIRYDRGNWGGHHADVYLKNAGIAPRERFELNAIESIAVMVNKDLGVAIIPLCTNAWLTRLDIVSMPLPEPCEPRRFGLIWSRASPRLSLIQAFLDAAQAEYRKLNRAGPFAPENSDAAARSTPLNSFSIV
jgi:DNA-binding transcriptional LysR family regulator